MILDGFDTSHEAAPRSREIVSVQENSKQTQVCLREDQDIIFFSYCCQRLKHQLKVESLDVRKFEAPNFLVQMTADRVSQMDEEWVNNCMREISEGNSMLF
jgi:hypothetical protein